MRLRERREQRVERAAAADANRQRVRGVEAVQDARCDRAEVRLRRDREQRGDAAHGAPVEEGRGARGAPRGARPDEREQRAEKGTAVEERCAAGLPLDVVREQRLCAAANGEERDFAAAPLRGGAGRGYTERRAERAGERAEERRAPRLARGAAEQIEEEIAAGGTHVSHRRHVILLRDELLRVRAPRAVLRRGHLHQGERRLDERHDELDAQRVLEQRLAARLEQHAVDAGFRSEELIRELGAKLVRAACDLLARGADGRARDLPNEVVDKVVLRERDGGVTASENGVGRVSSSVV